MTARGRWAVVAVLIVGWVALLAPGGLRGLETLSFFVAAATGVVVAARWPRVAERARALLDAVEGQDPVGSVGPGGVGMDAPGPRTGGATGAVATVLRTLADGLRADRLTVWRLGPGNGAVTAEWCTDATPEDQPSEGSPLTWTLAHDTVLRLDPRPAWARAETRVAPVDEARVLTVEGGAQEETELRAAGRILAAVLRLADRDEQTVRERGRVDRVVAFMRNLSRRSDELDVADALLGAALDATGAEGGLVAAWVAPTGVDGALDGDPPATAEDGAPGRVLVTSPGAPSTGSRFGPGDGDLAHAARVGATVRREPEDASTRPPLVSAGEGWSRPPLYRFVVPMVAPDGGVAGLTALWGHRPPSESGIRLLEALGPLVSVHLRQADDLAYYRARATRDALTGLPNRAAFDRRLEAEVARFHRYRRSLSLLVLDLDRFKAVNDTYGHAAGDAVLREVAGIVQATVRDVDAPARYGGEEMVVLMPETLVHAAREVAERVRQRVAATSVEAEGQTIKVTVSIGVSACPECVDSPAALFESADQALYEAKAAGRDQVVVYGYSTTST